MKLKIKKISKENFNEFVELINGFAEFQKIKAPDKNQLESLNTQKLI